MEFRRYSVEDAAAEAARLAERAGLAIESDAMALLIESLAADVARIAVEIEKLALYAGPGRKITTEDIGALVPDARATTIFVLVAALGRRDRARALAVLDTLVKDGEYLPLALAFLSSQFRLALAAKEAGLRSPQQIQAHFTRAGVPVWSSRAEQVYQTVSKVFERAAQEGNAPGLRSGQRAARRAAGRPHRDGALCDGADGLGRRAGLQRFDFDVQMGLVAGGCVHLDDAEFRRAVDHGKRLRQ